MSRIATITLCLLLAGCAADHTPGQLWGAGAGGVAGGSIARAASMGASYPWAFTGVGVIVGAATGYMIGDHEDPPAQRQWASATVAAAEAARPDEPFRWQGRSLRGSVTMVGAAWTDGGGRACRTLRQEAGPLDGAATYVRQVAACRVGDGGWEVSEPAQDSES